MDTIINGIVLSDHDDTIKEKLIKTIISRIFSLQNQDEQKSLLINIIDNLLQNDLTKAKWLFYILNYIHTLNSNSSSNNNNNIIYIINIISNHFTIIKLDSLFRLVIKSNQLVTTPILEEIVLFFNNFIRLKFNDDNDIGSIMMDIDNSSEQSVNDNNKLNNYLSIYKSLTEVLVTVFKDRLSLSIMNNLSIILNYITIISSNSLNQFLGTREETILNMFLKWLTQLSIEKQTEIDYNQITENIISLIMNIWTDSHTFIEMSLLSMLQSLTEQASSRDESLGSASSVDSITVSTSLADILNHSPIELIPLYVPLLIGNKSISDQHLYLTIRSLITLPVTPTNSAWILETLNTMITVKKNRLLVSLTIECSPILLKQMFQGPLLLEGAYDVMEKMLLGYQHSPDAFHQVVSLLPAIIEFIVFLMEKKKKLQQQQDISNQQQQQQQSLFINYKIHKIVKELTAMNDRKQLLLYAVKNSNDNTVNQWLLNDNLDRLPTLLGRISKLSWILMNHFSGYPELYNSLSDRLQRLGSPYNQIPKEFESKMVLKSNEWKGMQSMVFENAKVGRILSDRSGLFNLGNTCFMNSFLQSLYMTIPFRNYFLNEMDPPNLTQESIDLVMKRGNMVKQLQLLFGYLRYSLRSAFSPTKFLSTLSFEYQTGQQHDTYEFGKYLLDTLDSMIKYEMKTNKYLLNNNTDEQQNKIEQQNSTENNDSPTNVNTQTTTTTAATQTSTTPTPIPSSTIVTEMFGGNLEQSIKCLKCNHESISKEELFELSLAFPEQPANSLSKDTVDLDQLVHYFFSVEMLNGNNQYHCSKCESLQDAEKKLQLAGKPPKHLILSLKRFAYHVQSNSISKIFTIVDYPETLYIPPNYLKPTETTNTNTENNNNKNLEYKLYAIIFHSGTSTEHGHYFTYAKSSLSKDNDWCLLNDSNVQIIESIESIKEVPKKFKKDTPYLLFYRLSEPTTKSTTQEITNTEITEKQQQLHSEDISNIAPWIASEIKRDNKNLSESSGNTSILDSIKSLK